jgi:NADPH2 dehydrogenase
MSPSSNRRSDEYGDTNYFAQEVIRVVKQAMPKGMPLIFRVSAVEYNEDGYNFEDILNKCKTFNEIGVDVFDLSTGGNSPNQPKVYPAYQSEYARIYKQSLKLPIISIGRLENPKVAESIIQNGIADMVCIGRGMLRTPYWVKETASELGVDFEMPCVYTLDYK